VSGTVEDGVLLLTWKKADQDYAALLELAWDEEEDEVYLAGEWEGPKGGGTWFFFGPQVAK